MDGSHQHPDDFSADVIRFAMGWGWTGGQWNLQELLDAHDSGETDDVGVHVASEALYDASEDAVTWLNDQRSDDLFWNVDESCLFLEEIGE